MLAGVREVLIITTPRDQTAFVDLLGDGSQWGIRIEYAEQPSPGGLAQAFVIGRSFIDGHHSCLILGDNIFYGSGLVTSLRDAARRGEGATVFGYWVRDPERYGVAEMDEDGQVVSLEEKPETPKSNYAVTGLYFYDERACDYADTLRPSARGELEITDLNKRYLEAGQLRLEQLGRGIAWLDTGTHDSLIKAANFIETIEARQGLKVCSPEEVAYYNGWIDGRQLQSIAEPLLKSGYGEYLLGLLHREPVR
jgi:glucose-1-phosphate thymidylyltransferase